MQNSFFSSLKRTSLAQFVNEPLQGICSWWCRPAPERRRATSCWGRACTSGSLLRSRSGWRKRPSSCRRRSTPPSWRIHPSPEQGSAPGTETGFWDFRFCLWKGQFLSFIIIILCNWVFLLSRADNLSNNWPKVQYNTDLLKQTQINLYRNERIN